MDSIREEKNKNVFLDCLNQVITSNQSEVVFSKKPLQKNLMQYTHPLFRLMLMIDGEHAYTILRGDGIQDIKLNSDRALFCRRRGMTKVQEDAKGAGTMLTLVFFPQYIRFLISKRKQCNGDLQHLWYHSSHAVNQVGIHVLNALDELASVTNTDNTACLLTKALLNICRDNLIEDCPQNITKSFRTYQNIKAYLHENSHCTINRKSVARFFKLNPSHISKLFAAYDDQNFNTALKKLRLEHAVELLKDTTFSIDEITEQCGFTDTSYFIKTFRLSYGCSPGVFRQSNQ